MKGLGKIGLLPLLAMGVFSVACHSAFAGKNNDVSITIINAQMLADAKQNDEWKKVYKTEAKSQVVFMDVSPETNPKNEVGQEKHSADHMILVVSGKGESILNGSKDKVSAGDYIYVPKDSTLNIINKSKTEPLKTIWVYTDKTLPPDYNAETISGKKLSKTMMATTVKETCCKPVTELAENQVKSCDGFSFADILSAWIPDVAPQKGAVNANKYVITPNDDIANTKHVKTIPDEDNEIPVEKNINTHEDAVTPDQNASITHEHTVKPHENTVVKTVLSSLDVRKVHSYEVYVHNVKPHKVYATHARKVNPHKVYVAHKVSSHKLYAKAAHKVHSHKLYAHAAHKVRSHKLYAHKVKPHKVYAARQVHSYEIYTQKINSHKTYAQKHKVIAKKQSPTDGKSFNSSINSDLGSTQDLQLHMRLGDPSLNKAVQRDLMLE